MTRVLVTGGAGFVGHHLVLALLSQGHEVVVLDNLRRGSFEREAFERVSAIRGDVTDLSACRQAVEGCDVVVHLAAQANVMGSEAEPDYTFQTNVAGTWNVARAAGGAGVDHLVFASSREVYGDCDRLPVPEDASMRPKNVYGATKVAGEALLRGGAAGATGVTVLRLANVIGKGDTGRVVPNWLAAAARGAPLEMYGGKQELDFLPVETCVAAFLRAISLGPFAQPINVGSGRGIPLTELARRILLLFPGAAGVRALPARGAEVVRFAADIRRMRELLGVSPPGDPLASLAAYGEDQ